jgi:ABC-type branched-subunit amino acid transport system substrate-binding protein
MVCRPLCAVSKAAFSLLAFVVAHAQGASAEPFRAGVIVPLSGPLAEYGTAISNGITLATETRPELFSKCEFTLEDSAYKTTQALSAMQKLQTVNKVDLVYVFGGPMGEALAPVAESKRMPLIIDHIDGNAVAGKKFSVRYANSKRELGRTLVASLDKRQIRKVAIVAVDNQYVNSLVEGFSEEAAGKISVEVVARVTPDDGDLRYLAPKVRAAKVDAIGLFLFPAQASSLARNLHLPNAKLFGSDFLESPTALVDANGALEGALYPNNIIDEEFQRRYQERFKSEAQIKFGAEGYDVAMMLGEQLCSRPRQEWQTPEGVMNLLTAVPKRRGAQGETEFKVSADGDRYFSAPVVTKVASKTGFRPE